MSLINPTPTPVPAPPPSMDIGGLVNRVVGTAQRRWWIVAVVAAPILAIAVLVTSRMTPRYSAVASVLVDTTQQVAPTKIIDPSVASGWQDTGSILDTEVEVMKSRALASRVVDALNLDADPEFQPNKGTRSKLIGLIKAPLKAIGRGDRPAGSTPAPTETDREFAHQAVIDQLLSHVGFHRSGATYMIDLEAESSDPTKAALIANTYADKYLTERMQAKYEAAQQANQWLNQRLSELQPQVEQAEAAVERYKADHGLLAAVGSPLTQQEISNLNSQLDQARADVTEKDARLATAQQSTQDGAPGQNLTGPLSSSTNLGSLRAQEGTARSKLADLQTKYGSKHPDVQRAERELADIDRQISEEVTRDVGSLRAEDQIAHQRVASLESSLAAAKGALMGNNAASVELGDLQRKADAASTLYENLLARAKQASIASDADQPGGRIVSRASVPLAASSPKWPVNLALGAMLGVAAGVGLVFLLELMESGLGTSEEVERSLGLPHLGSVPLLQSTFDRPRKRIGSPTEYAAKNPLSLFAESFRSLRASVLYSQNGASVRVIGITSALPNEGKSTTAIGLGQAMAFTGSRVVIVDCDLRRASISQSLKGATGAAGLVEVLQGKAKLEDAIVRDTTSGAWFLPIVASEHAAKDLFGSPAMDRLLEELRHKFDFVVLDTAPVMAVSDTRLLATKCDAVILLAHWRKTPRKAVQSAIALLTSVGADMAGVALTQVDMRSQSKYGDTSNYSRYFRNYYVQ